MYIFTKRKNHNNKINIFTIIIPVHTYSRYCTIICSVKVRTQAGGIKGDNVVIANPFSWNYLSLFKFKIDFYEEMRDPFIP